MRQIWKSFRALYFAALMMLIGSGLLSTYLALRLAAGFLEGRRLQMARGVLLQCIMGGYPPARFYGSCLLYTSPSPRDS